MPDLDGLLGGQDDGDDTLLKGRIQITHPKRGPSAAGQRGELSGGTAQFELHDVVAYDNHTVSLCTITAQRAGKQYHDNVVHVMHIQDGKVTEVWTHAADPFAAREFWS